MLHCYNFTLHNIEHFYTSNYYRTSSTRFLRSTQATTACGTYLRALVNYILSAVLLSSSYLLLTTNAKASWVMLLILIILVSLLRSVFVWVLRFKCLHELQCPLKFHQKFLPLLILLSFQLIQFNKCYTFKIY